MEEAKKTRGRPKKVLEPVEDKIVEQHSMTPEEETEAMKEQLKYQFMQMAKMMEKLGMKPTDIFETPPSEDTVVLERVPIIDEDEDEEVEEVVKVRNGRPKPGTTLPGGNWIPWSKHDLDPNAQIEFVPQPVPSLVFPMEDEEGRQKIKLDVQDLVCWLTVGVPNKVNRFFYNAYVDSYNTWKELEAFKRTGPQFAPWGRTGPDGRPAWHYEPMALTFAMDIDGRYLRLTPGWSGGVNEPAPETITESAATE